MNAETSSARQRVRCPILIGIGRMPFLRGAKPSICRSSIVRQLADQSIIALGSSIMQLRLRLDQTDRDALVQVNMKETV